MMLLCIPSRANSCRLRALKLAAYYQTTRRNTTNSEQAEKLKVLFMGRDEFSCLVLEELYKARDVWDELVIATNPDQRVGRRGSQLSVSPLKLKIESLGDVRLEFIPPTKAEFKKWKLPVLFESYACATDTANSTNPPPQSHVLVTASFGRILTRKHLSHFQPTRRLNVHPSLLPQYRGPAPIQHALLNGESKTGVCVVEMLPSAKKASGPPPPKSGIDAGDIWASKSMPQPGDARFNQMREALGREGGKLLVQVLRDMVNRREKAPVPQYIDGSSEVRPAPMIELEDAHFDPKSFTAEEVSRRWRAIGHQRPITTFVEVTSSDGSATKRAVQLHDLQVRSDMPDAVLRALPLTPGSVICARPNNEPSKSLFVRCEDGGVISVRDIKPEGKPILDARSFWNGVHGKNKEVRVVGD